MQSSKIMIILVLMIAFSLVLVSCVAVDDKPEEVEETGSSNGDDWKSGDETPPYAYAKELRDKLDPVIEDTFGIVEVEYRHYDSVRVNAAGEGSYNVRYVIKNAPPHDEFLAYRIIHDTLDRVFDFVSFADADDLEGYVSMYGEEIPEEIGVALLFEGENYYWEVSYDGTYIGFYSF